MCVRAGLCPRECPKPACHQASAAEGRKSRFFDAALLRLRVLESDALRMLAAQVPYARRARAGESNVFRCFVKFFTRRVNTDVAGSDRPAAARAEGTLLPHPVANHVLLSSITMSTRASRRVM